MFIIVHWFIFRKWFNQVKTIILYFVKLKPTKFVKKSLQAGAEIMMQLSSPWLLQTFHWNIWVFLSFFFKGLKLQNRGLFWAHGGKTTDFFWGRGINRTQNMLVSFGEIPECHSTITCRGRQTHMRHFTSTSTNGSLFHVV